MNSSRKVIKKKLSVLQFKLLDMVSVAALLFFISTLSSAGTGFEDADKIVYVPKVVSEEVTVLPLVMKLDEIWKANGQISVENTEQKFHGKDLIEINYRISQPNDSAYLDYRLPKDHPIAERLRFWVKSDGSGSDFEILCYHTKSKSWLSLSSIILDSYQWLHLEIPASNPIYRYYGSVTAFRFVLKNNNLFDGVGKHKLLLGELELVNSEAVKEPLVNRMVPAPVFNTWGGPSRRQFLDSKSVGTTMHIAPIDNFFSDKSIAERVAYAEKAVKWADEIKVMPAIQFYGHPGKGLDDHPELFVKNQDGEIQRDGGSFSSPWNPQARQLWREHIIESLKYLNEKDVLKHIQVVQISPGEEGELCYNWNGVWAFDEYAVKAFRKYLKEFYQSDIGKLNLDWASKYERFDDILPPSEYYPDRYHWVFADFYRLSMLNYSVFLADSVNRVFTPRYWLWMTHTLPGNPGRFYSARYALFYTENLRRLGYIDYAHIAALDWQGPEDVEYLKNLSGVKVIGEIDIVPTEDRMKWTFDQCEKFGTDGVFIGIRENLSADGKLTELGKFCQQRIRQFR